VSKFYKTDWSLLSLDIQESRKVVNLLNSFYLDLVSILSGEYYDYNEEEDDEDYYEEDEEEYYDEKEEYWAPTNEYDSHIMQILDMMTDVSVRILLEKDGDMNDVLCDYFSIVN
ncbi:hypothetical protein HZS_1147, partial [Henneguya salminicola]